MKRKNRNTLFAAVVVLLVAASLLSVNAFRAPAPSFNGSRVCNPEAYRLDFTALNGSDTHIMALRAGDSLRVCAQVDKGTLGLSLSMDDGTKLYRSNALESGEFTVEAPKDGQCTIEAVGKKAAGSLYITLEP